MSETEQGVTYEFTWHSLPDACKKCAYLNGYTFLHQDLFQHTLDDPVEGPVWDLDADHSLAHGGTPHNCRCTLEAKVNFEIADTEGFPFLQETVTRFGKPVTIHRDPTSGRFMRAP